MKFKLTENYTLFEEFVFDSRIYNVKVNNCIKEAAKIMQNLGYEFEPDLVFVSNNSHSAFGQFKFPDNKYGTCTIRISANHFNDSEESITNTILHEMAHYFAYKNSLETNTKIQIYTIAIAPVKSHFLLLSL